MYFITKKSGNAHKFKQGRKAVVTLANKDFEVTIVKHNEISHVDVEFDEPILIRKETHNVSWWFPKFCERFYIDVEYEWTKILRFHENEVHLTEE
ncbi:MAG: hypothetical protein R3B60_04170 [Candidatus Paceibacterota bacterium]